MKSERLINIFKDVGLRTNGLLVRIGRALPDIPDCTLYVYTGNDRPPMATKTPSLYSLLQGGSLSERDSLRHARAWESLGKALVERAEQERING
ncbi:hypothetical protein A3A14_01755 [Candidatus Daviesbacteria bacterium RIFCSPLOWO2_01_FULL_43_38]|uniref:Uncharacterized protein n=2 Tax=Candidatus Daviesiibacteriota TaxID=1752718 RepID=A0A1F5K524_9BACT|nr:MAG: hypothetical protein UV41_C0056G0003 [Candidatus Daviesbacteria bacterium GW2011_GWA2_42_7]OGE20163.1 MAG: hypothetical protein A2874_03265 [Candidatus Daviesbacteria bacterium RIFCSPHIGHO2_01_FULL_43_17]OGE36072.1 MAG: hypothetical protein A3E45_04025 [Candidatus Daviesbacteria bacterium RIFCSPHIGHO2_12_FULL_43_11]OGE63966.1 MAG: hypothetical protein A3A14_01755 [Candidatus Daviesbacteria bacterium RIFCSPLOWO2_01_FULL_43_38]OGE68979.1 MAG: hypothetical protein A3J21_01300 [Candidatus D